MGCLVPFYPDKNNPDTIINVDECNLYERICCHDLINYDKIGTEVENLSKTEKNHKLLQELVP